MVRQGQIRRRQHISGIDDSGLAQCDPFRPVTTGRFRGLGARLGFPSDQAVHYTGSA